MWPRAWTWGMCDVHGQIYSSFAVALRSGIANAWFDGVQEEPLRLVGVRHVHHHQAVAHSNAATTARVVVAFPFISTIARCKPCFLRGCQQSTRVARRGWIDLRYHRSAGAQYGNRITHEPTQRSVVARIGAQPLQSRHAKDRVHASRSVAEWQTVAKVHAHEVAVGVRASTGVQHLLAFVQSDHVPSVPILSARMPPLQLQLLVHNVGTGPCADSDVHHDGERRQRALWTAPRAEKVVQHADGQLVLDACAALRDGVPRGFLSIVKVRDGLGGAGMLASVGLGVAVWMCGVVAAIVDAYSLVRILWTAAPITAPFAVATHASKEASAATPRRLTCYFLNVGEYF